MAENLAIESPEFDKIRKGDSTATEDAVRLLWFVANEEIKERRKGIRLATDREKPRVLALAVTTNQDNLHRPMKEAIVTFSGSSNINLTGIAGGEEGERITIHVLGSGTVTLVDDSASSDTNNRIITADGNDLAIQTNESAILHYLNSRWRQLKLA